MNALRMAVVVLAASVFTHGAELRAQDAPAPQEKSCLGLTRIESTEVLDNRNIAFRMVDGSRYLNTLPRPCPGLRRNTPYLYRTSLSELCDLDTITVLNQVGSGFMEGATCGLGKFVPADAPVTGKDGDKPDERGE